MHIHEPLAQRMRPKDFDDFFGNERIAQQFNKMVQESYMPSMILWGPPGVGKTTLAQILSYKTKMPFYAISAIQSGVKEVREILAIAANEGTIILFVDEIHRFNKSQQDSLLKAIEEGLIIFIGATTENPSFEVNNALLSRCQVFVLKPFDEETLKKMALNAIEKDEILKSKEIKMESLDALIHRSGGDGRKLLNLLELVVNFSESPVVINDQLIEEFIATQTDAYDKTGDLHYDIISAFIKSIRGSDPNAALYYLARMIDGGEDPKFIARRLLILASEDISLANPNALLLANTTFDAVVKIGYPECQIILSQLVVYLSTSPKSNSTYLALKKAQACHRNHPNLSIPLHLRNAPTGLMKKLDYGKDYKYAHDYDGNFVDQEFLPDSIKDEIFYKPSKNPKEQEIAKDLARKWKKYQ